MTDPCAPRLLDRLPAPPRRVAILRAGRIGDLLCATPAFRALRQALPDAEFTLIGLPFARDLIERSRRLDRFESFPGFPGIAEQWFDARRAVEFFARMQARHFDLALQMHGSGVHSNPVALLLGAPVTAGFIRPGADPSRLDAAFTYPADRHEIRRCLAFTTFLGAPAFDEAMEFPLLAADRAEADCLLAGLAPPLIGLHPFARDDAKRWPVGRFGEATRRVRNELGGSVVVLGSEEDRSTADRLAAAIGPPVRSLAGATSLGGLGSVVERLAVLIANDSGPAHIASALRVPSVILFGPTDPAAWGPPTDGPHRVIIFDPTCDAPGSSLAEGWHPSVDAVAATAMTVVGDRGRSEVNSVTGIGA